MNGLLSKQFLDDIGVVLDERTYQTLSGHYEDTLNNRVITELVNELDEKQLEELHAFQGKNEESALREWLTINCPQLNEIIEDEVAILLGEVAENSTKL